jgi:hypothetical protein
MDQLVKEAKASPVKAGALGLLCVVALWFWGPLVLKWLRPEEEGVDPAAVAVASPTPGAAATPAAANSPAAAVLDWRALQKLRASDPRVQALRLAEGMRDPFWKETTGVAAGADEVTNKPREEGDEASPMVVELNPVPPEEAGLVLQGTLVSTRRKLATINGRTYEVGMVIVGGAANKASGGEEQPVESATNVDAKQELEYRVMEITPSSVVLEHRGMQFSLALKKPAASDDQRMQIERKRAG